MAWSFTPEGLKRIDETQLYVNLVDAHRRPLPAALVAVGAREQDPDRRVLLMLGARCSSVAAVSDGKENAAWILVCCGVGRTDSDL